MVTLERLEQLRSERRKKIAFPELTPDEGTTQEVHAGLDQERETKIDEHERAFMDAQRDMRREHALSRQRGQPRALFNNPKMEITP